jgi:addiction module RelB/DinJ family antitoxin
MPITDVIRARSDHAAKERAAAALADMGLPIADAIRLLMLGAGERRMPSEGRAPKPMTQSALAERETSQAKAFADFEDLMADLRNTGD